MSSFLLEISTDSISINDADKVFIHINAFGGARFFIVTDKDLTVLVKKQ